MLSLILKGFAWKKTSDGKQQQEQTQTTPGLQQAVKIKMICEIPLWAPERLWAQRRNEAANSHALESNAKPPGASQNRS